MLNQLFETEWQPLSHPMWASLKRQLLMMLALWMSYFLLVHTFVHSLNKVLLLGIPLGTCLAVQGAAIMFAITLFRFARVRV